MTASDGVTEQILQSIPRRVDRILDAMAASSPDKVALIDNDAAYTYGQLRELVDHVAGDFRRLGIRSGDRIMIVSENCTALVALFLAASSLDVWAIVVNPRLSPRELDAIQEHSGARRIFLTATLSRDAAKHADRLNAVPEKLGTLGNVVTAELIRDAVPEPVENSGADQVALLVYTSGTTGKPKGVMLTHQNILFSAKAIAITREMGPADTAYIVLPMSHIAGMSLLLMMLLSGATARLSHQFDPALLLKAIYEERITVLYGVPATYQKLLEHMSVVGDAGLGRADLRALAVVGAPMDPALKKRIRDKFGLNLLNGYGITECSPGISGSRIDVDDADLSVGPLLPGIEGRIVSADGRPLTDGDVGELVVRGPYVMRGYYRDPGQTGDVIDRSGWFKTGDLAYFRDGLLYIAGRTKEMIIRSGFNVYPAEVEAVLNAHDAVLQSAVVGTPAAGNEEVVAFVQLVQGKSVTSDELMSYVRPLLTAYKRPSRIIVLDSLPSSSTGKLLKRQLADSLIPQQSR